MSKSGMYLQLWACICTSGLYLQARACRLGVVFGALGLYLVVWACICKSGLYVQAWACICRSGMYLQLWACICRSGLFLPAWACICLCLSVSQFGLPVGLGPIVADNPTSTSDNPVSEATIDHFVWKIPI